MPHIDLASEGGRQIPVEYRLPADARRVCIIAHGFASSKESATAQMMLDHLEKLGLGALRKAVVEGDVVNGTVMAGQIAGMVNREQTCREMIEEIMEQAQKLLAKPW